MVTSCCRSPASRSFSAGGEPIRNLPAGISVSFIPMELVMTLSPPRASGLAGSSAAERPIRAHAARQVRTGRLILHLSEQQPPRPEDDHEGRRKPGQDFHRERPALLDV